MFRLRGETVRRDSKLTSINGDTYFGVGFNISFSRIDLDVDNGGKSVLGVSSTIIKVSNAIKKFSSRISHNVTTGKTLKQEIIEFLDLLNVLGHVSRSKLG